MKRGETIVRNKNVNSFLTEKNTFNLISKNPDLIKLYESDINGRLETVYPTILREISAHKISQKSEAVLKQFIANLFCRSKKQRHEMASHLENSSLKESWIKIFIHALEHDDLSKDLGIQWEPQTLQNYSNHLLGSSTEIILNDIMLLYTLTFSRLVYPLKMVILESPNEEMQWFTSDSPVIAIRNLRNETSFKILGVDSELYFPLSPKYLVYLCYSGSSIVTKHRNLKHLSISKVSGSEIDRITREHILPNAYEYVISPGPV